MSPNTSQPEPIAIIGTGCRFAGGANSPSKMWELIRNPRDVRVEIPISRFNAKGFYHENAMHHGHTNVKHSYLLTEDPYCFDANFFNINAVEAAAMDPQQRLLLEVVYEAMESAGLSIEKLRGSDTGVFVGAMRSDYEGMLLRDIDQLPKHFQGVRIKAFSCCGTNHSLLSNRISYFWGWTGSSVTMNTACSSSLVAVDQGVHALRSGNSHMVVACGSNLILSPELYVVSSKMQLVSPDSRSRMWDKAANGYARADGVAAVILKTLRQALADGDRIEAVIRGIGVNHDGTSAGISIPNPDAQRALVRSVYRKAGLNPDNPAHQPQYVELHGTGTPTGGHSEATSGISGLLKIVQAMQNSTIPPNLLFDQLNPAIAPFYVNMLVPTEAVPWPAVKEKQPKRACLNNFGFGGTNAHLILESYEAPRAKHCDEGPISELVTPFVFSAASSESLRANLEAYVAYLDEHPETDIHDLAYTLRERRSVLRHRISIPATNIASLKSGLQAILAVSGNPTLGVKARISTGGRQMILGVFTGQGAQYARMGCELIEKSPLARSTIQTLENYLAVLPEKDRPKWSLYSEIMADPSVSRINESAISLPICTAVQIMIVDILHSANIRFGAVVGHSADYRGLACQHAACPNGNIKGAMVAVGTSLQDAMELCENEEFSGRITVAAINSSSSLTISGDEDAIDELSTILDDEHKFNRRLKVNLASHSTHMLPCVDPYLESLRQVGVEYLPGHSHCTWFSSVYGGRAMGQSTDQLRNTYWTENMTNPVQFSQAVRAACLAIPSVDEDTPAVVLEVGAHPALATPAMQTIEEAIGTKIPYHGTLSRGNDAVLAFSSCFGFLWEHLDSRSMSLERCEGALSGDNRSHHRRYNVLGNLPTYQWNHEVAYSAESRWSRRMHLRDPYHQLLGSMSPDSASHMLRWKNVLKVSELPWLEAHTVQNMAVVPGALYVSSAIEAARSLAAEKSIQLIDLTDLQFPHLATFNEGGDKGIEVHIELSQIQAKPEFITATFTYSAALGGDSDDLVLAASGKLKVILQDDESYLTVLPDRALTPPYLKPIDTNGWYDFLKGRGFQFSGPFRSMVKLERTLDRAVCVGKKARTSISDADALLVHPVDFDNALQSILLAHSHPTDGQLNAPHVLSGIKMLRVNAAVLTSKEYLDEDTNLVYSSCFNANRKPSEGFAGNVSVYTPSLTHEAIRIYEAACTPLGTTANEGNARNLFFKMDWVQSQPDGLTSAANIPITEQDHDFMSMIRRIAVFYLRKFNEMVAENSPARTDGLLCHYLNFARHVTSLVTQGGNDLLQTEWLNDTEEDIMNLIHAKSAFENVDVKILLLVGRTMPAVFRGETTMLEHFRTSNLLDEYYVNGCGMKQTTTWIGNLLTQLTTRNPHLRLFEIGAGTGGATKDILDAIGHNFQQYTFTDISAGFFENAAEKFSAWKDRMDFKVYNGEIDPANQGIEVGSYDVVIAYMVVHACENLHVATANLRKLLKPGGLLILGEAPDDGPLLVSLGFAFGGLAGWWCGVKEGRRISPLVSPAKWESILKGAGFSGIDTMSPPSFSDAFGMTLFVSTALDERVEKIRNPELRAPATRFDKVIVLGGQTEPIGKLVHNIRGALAPFTDRVLTYESLEKLDHTVVDTGSIVVSLVDLESPVFQELTTKKWKKLRNIFTTELSILWLTSGRLDGDPYSNATVGFGRAAVHETPGLRIQYIDFPEAGRINPKAVLEDDSILYTKEPELAIDVHGRELVPRLVALREANNRYNSVNTPVHEYLDTRETTVELCLDPTQNNFFLQNRGEFIQLDVTHSTMSALSTVAGYQFLVIGKDKSGGQRLALVSSLMSILMVPLETTVQCDIPSGSGAGFLAHVAADMIAIAVTNLLHAGQSLLLHNASNAVGEHIIAQASHKTINIIATCDSSENKALSCQIPHISVSTYTTASELAHVLPSNVACFIDFSAKKNTGTSRMILSCLPSFCRKESIHTLFSVSGGYNGFPLSALGQLLRSATHRHPVGIDNILNGEPPSYPLTVMDWESRPATLPVRITRIDGEQLFKGDKTYWIVGLSGTLGISLCDWMIVHGARHIVFTSRDPKIDSQWIEVHRLKGASVHILPGDVTDEQAIRAVYQTIVNTKPPIAGLVNGAMVLKDTSIINMGFDDIIDVLQPKMDGAVNLDSIFHSINLDFFVMISSMAGVIGNPGQANYSAASMGLNSVANSEIMSSVAVRRRKRGLQASIVNLGKVIGVGYVTQADQKLNRAVEDATPISEHDFHYIFAESIAAGRLESSTGPEICTGLLSSSNTQILHGLYSDPKFTHLRVSQISANGSISDVKKNAYSILEKLQGCNSIPDVFHIIRAEFSAQLRRSLHISTADDDLMKMQSAELGLDSLVSVDLQNWFIKNLQVSITSRKIMACQTRMSSLVEMAVQNIPADLIPGALGDDPTMGSSEEMSDLDTELEPCTPMSPITPDDGNSEFELKFDGELENSDSTNEAINWEAEASLPRPERILELVPAPPIRTTPEVIVLTGCTGFVGRHILKTLMACPTIRKIICIAVRRLSERVKDNKLLPPSRRLVYHEGDLSLPRFGLSEDIWADIFCQADAVVHCGFSVRLTSPYAAERAVNVESTRQLLGVCLQRMVPIHYMSSVMIGLLAGVDAFSPTSCTQSMMRPSAEQGYVAAKWVCESMLERAQKQHGLHVVINRASPIYDEGVGVDADDNEFSFGALVRYAHKTQAVPRFDSKTFQLDFVSLGTFCDDVITELLRNVHGTGKVRYIHSVGDIVIPVREIANIGLEKIGGPYRVLPMEQWTKVAMEAGMQPAVAPVIEFFNHPVMQAFPRLVRTKEA
ncbi:hypothetical protein F5B22DRAFT_634851 [Xylaria bambusicola]|uniref:uncharacterized protein n=1 Tax=Xylaria bambusicola TaxID=326684 RepID=UPI002007A74E|nr:uncharacterized protein F5B22DRAFT_634851 [Xylaria bambusicola]KAI0521008.1 hypothetical protein F5B22DRAFT_634851 [Xylaria bambusicola]